MSKTALLLMDLQAGIVSRFCNDPNYIKRLQEVKSAARAAGLQVIYVVVKFRAQFPEVSQHNKTFSALKSGGFPLIEGNSEAAVCDELVPDSTDILVTKRRVSAFSGSDLEVV